MQLRLKDVLSGLNVANERIKQLEIQLSTARAEGREEGRREALEAVRAAALSNDGGVQNDWNSALSVASDRIRSFLPAPQPEKEGGET